MAARYLTRPPIRPGNQPRFAVWSANAGRASIQLARARPAIASRDLTYSTGWNPVSMVTLVPVTLPCT